MHVARPASADGSRVQIETEESDGLAGVAVNTQNAPWQVLTALASECAHIVRHASGLSESLPVQGNVQQESQASISSRSRTPGSSDLEGKADSTPPSRSNEQHTGPHAPSNDSPDTSAVEAEAARVSAKFLVSDAANTQVVQRFDFMKSRDTRVWAFKQATQSRST